jgi:hypothetical protein
MLDNLSENDLLKNLRKVLTREDLTLQRASISTIATELNIDSLDCASALLYLLQNANAPVELITSSPLAVVAKQANIKMIRYRLNIGSKHQLTLDTLKQVLVEESGVDKNNISNVKIQDLYTLCDLPDEMPLDIFQHLKLVEINQHKLDIRRVKARNKKRGSNHHRRGRQVDAKMSNQSCQSG